MTEYIKTKRYNKIGGNPTAHHPSLTTAAGKGERGLILKGRQVSDREFEMIFTKDEVLMERFS